MKLKDIMEQEQQIIVPGVGSYTYGTLKSDLTAKLQDMINRTQQNNFHTLGDSHLDIIKLFWQTLRQYTPQQ